MSAGQSRAIAGEVFVGGGDMGALMRSYDWSQTPLGAVQNWSQSLKTAVRIMLTSRQAMFVWWGEDLINLYNDAYRAILGGKHPEALGQPASQVWREIWDQVGPRAASAIRNNEGTYDEALLLIMERNGYPEETYYTFSYSPVPDIEGRTGGIICANTDDTQRIIGERQLALLKELASRTADARTFADACALSAICLSTNPHDLPFGMIYLVEPDQQCAVLAGTCGIEQGHPLAPATIALNHPDWHFADVLRSQQPAVITALAAHCDPLPTGAWQTPPQQLVVVPIAPSGKTGKAGILVAGLNPFRLLDDNYQRFLNLIAAQIAASIANAQAYEEERKRAEALAELDRAKTTFFSNISHEFRTPLTLMLSPLEEMLANNGGMAEAQRQQLELVHRNSLRLLKLVNTLLDFSRIEAGRVQAVYEPTDLSALTAELASVFRSAIEQAGLQLVVACEPLSESVYVDREMWEKIVLNLLSNAFKFTFEGAIAVTLRQIQNQVELTVRDTGIGIPAAELPRLFERFYRVEGAQGRTQEGSGIGLALVQELVRLHGGQVQVESHEGEGTTFILTLPTGTHHLPPERLRQGEADRVQAPKTLASAALGAAPYVEEALRWLPEADGQTNRWGDDVSLPTPIASSPPSNAAACILLVDDNTDMRGYVKRLLLHQGYDVETAADGIAALAAIEHRRPDLVLTDVMMPRLDGFGLLRKLRSSPATKDIPIILLSARAGEEARVGGLEAGADDYLTKPFSARELLARVEASLKLSRLRHETTQRERIILERVTDAFMAMDRDFRFTYANEAAQQVTQTSLEAMLGKTLWEVFPGTVGSQFEAQYRRSLREQIAVEFEEYYAPLDLWVEVHVYPSPSGLSLFFRDINDRKQIETERKQAEAEREQLLARERDAREEAETANRIKDEFLAVLSHELRSPLNPILGWSRLLQTRPFDPIGAQRALQTIERNAKLQAQLIEDLLDVSRILQGKMVLNVYAVNLATVIESSLETVRLAIDAKQIHIRTVIAFDNAQTIGDATRLQQIVWNLLSNAVKFTPAGGQIEVRLDRIGTYAQIQVKDSGKGISPGFLPYVFDYFRQEDGTTTRKFGGLGLGLAIVRHLTELHGGTVEAESPGEGQGATFSVRLPLITKVTGPEEARLPLAKSTNFDQLSILVVDDEEDMRDLVQVILERQGAQVTVVASAADVLLVFDRQPPDIFISDIGMPEIDGYMLMQQIRSRSPDQGGQVPAIALTAYAGEYNQQQAFVAGFQRHLSKPIDPDHLIATIASLVVRP